MNLRVRSPSEPPGVYAAPHFAGETLAIQFANRIELWSKCLKLSEKLIEEGVHVAIPSAFRMLAGAVGLVVAWTGLASHSSLAIGRGAICMFAHQFVSLPCR